jgi:V/A-type H+-transporting ATPase subunit I
MLIGDAGYGLVYILLAMFMQRKMKHLKDKRVFSLVYLLSSCAVVWGLITGIFFGPHKWLRPLIPYFSKDINTQAFCFLIGTTQLSIAHLWKFLRKWPSLKALSDIGWVFILWAAYLLANTLILSKTFPVFGKYFFIIGAALVILFTNPLRNIFKGIGIGLGDFLLKVMGSFGDIVSYVRLFAVGAAGVAIAAAFNQMAAGVGTRTFIAGLICFIILFLGHTLNIVMGILAVLVHGVRLNVLEFSGHLDMEWSGVEYAPFKEA